jgi:hypothetical protein
MEHIGKSFFQLGAESTRHILLEADCLEGES